MFMLIEPTIVLEMLIAKIQFMSFSLTQRDILS